MMYCICFSIEQHGEGLRLERVGEHSQINLKINFYAKLRIPVTFESL